MTKAQEKLVTAMAKHGIELEARINRLEARVEEMLRLSLWHLDYKRFGNPLGKQKKKQ